MALPSSKLLKTPILTFFFCAHLLSLPWYCPNENNPKEISTLLSAKHDKVPIEKYRQQHKHKNFRCKEMKSAALPSFIVNYCLHISFCHLCVQGGGSKIVGSFTSPSDWYYLSCHMYS